MPSLFEPMRLGGITLNNRIAVSPMCQYSAENGAANDWHLQHLGSLSYRRRLVIVEQTAVEPAGRISHGCLGLYSDANEAGLARVIDFCRRAGWAALGIQLAHTGRKGSAKLPWEGGRPLVPEDGAWTTAAPSAVPFDNRWRAPGSARRSRNDPYSRRPRGSGKGARNGWASISLIIGRARLSAAQLPFANQRSTHRFLRWSLANRMGYPLAVAAAIGEVWPRRKALGMRITGTDWVDGVITPDEASVFAGKLRDIGFDYVCVSSGGISPAARPAIAPGTRCRSPPPLKGQRDYGAGGRHDRHPHQAEAIVADGQRIASP